MIDVPVLYGPTASGKSRLALEVASSLRGVEIVSADSRQVYVGMDIGTAKPTPAEQSIVPHHCIDLICPSDRYSAGAYARHAAKVIQEIAARGSIPFVVGGSGFYLRALFHGLAAPMLNPDVEDALWRRIDSEGYEVIVEELSARDPDAASVIPAANRVRVVRALACVIQTGRTFTSHLHGKSTGGSLRPHYLVLDPPRERLYANINNRFERMVEEGLVGETRDLAATYGADAHALQGIGYRESLAYLRGELSFDRMMSLGKQGTRRYAKRQYTWINGMWNREEAVRVESPDADFVAKWIARCAA